MATSLNVQSAKRADARSMAAHAYRHGKSEGHVDQDRTHLNQVLHGPATFEAARAAIDALPDKQPNGRKIRTDANYTAQVVCTFPKELPEAQLETWARETVKWAEHDAPGKLLYAVMHRDEGRPHIHMGIAALEPDGKLNYRALFGRESLADAGENLLAMQKSYAERISHLGVEATQGNDYEDTGPNAWRILKAREEGRQEKAAELERAAAELNAEKSKNLVLAQSLETAGHRDVIANHAKKTLKERAETAELKRDQEKRRAETAEREKKAQEERADKVEQKARLDERKKAAVRVEGVIQLADKEYKKLDAEHIEKYNALVETHNSLLDRCRPWLNLAKQFVKNGLLNAQKVLKAGMVEYGIWDKLGPRVMDDPDPQPEPEQKPEQDPGGPVLG